MENNIKIDGEEYTKQFRQTTLASREYVRVEVLIPTAHNAKELISTYPLCDVDVSNSNPWTVAIMAKSLEDTAQYMLDKYDARDAYEAVASAIRDTHKIEISKEEKKDNEE